MYKLDIQFNLNFELQPELILTPINCRFISKCQK